MGKKNFSRVKSKKSKKSVKNPKISQKEIFKVVAENVVVAKIKN